MDETNTELATITLLSREDAAKRLNISPRTLWNYTAPRGKLPAVRIGRTLRYSVADLEEFVGDRTVRPG